MRRGRAVEGGSGCDDMKREAAARGRLPTLQEQREAKRPEPAVHPAADHQVREFQRQQVERRREERRVEREAAWMRQHFPVIPEKREEVLAAAARRTRETMLACAAKWPGGYGRKSGVLA